MNGSPAITVAVVVTPVIMAFAPERRVREAERTVLVEKRILVFGAVKFDLRLKPFLWSWYFVCCCGEVVVAVDVVVDKNLLSAGQPPSYTPP